MSEGQAYIWVKIKTHDDTRAAGWIVKNHKITIDNLSDDIFEAESEIKKCLAEAEKAMQRRIGHDFTIRQYGWFGEDI